ncbi:MAG TPA: oxidoreductase [Bacteroidales bacterium]|nr:oxidoreductase [Bacteroidales bacterium]
MSAKRWNAENIPSQEGKKVLITGANSGIGFEASRVLSSKGAQVIMAVRNLRKGKESADKIRKENPDAKLDVMMLDLSDFSSIRNFSGEFHKKYSQLNILINNAGVMAPKKRELTKQNFEIQFGTNHLGHFLLTGLLFDILKNSPGSRVVVQSSIVHKQKFYGADIHFKDLNWEKGYNKEHAYGQSKLANLLFAYELDRRIKAHNIKMIVTAAHPGYTNTNLQKHYGFLFSAILNNVVAQNVKIGTLPVVRAATEENLNGSEYFGPTRMMEMRGYPELVQSSEKSYDKELAAKLWDVSEKLTGFTYNFERNSI